MDLSCLSSKKYYSKSLFPGSCTIFFYNGFLGLGLNALLLVLLYNKMHKLNGVHNFQCFKRISKPLSHIPRILQECSKQSSKEPHRNENQPNFTFVKKSKLIYLFICLFIYLFIYLFVLKIYKSLRLHTAKQRFLAKQFFQKSLVR